MSEDRRAFLKTVGGVSAALAGTSVLAGASALAEEPEDAARPEVEAAPAPRPYATGTFGLELEGILIGLLKTLQGGNAFAEVVTEAGGPAGSYPRKHIAQPKYEDVVLAAGTGMGADFYAWIQAALDLDWKRRNGAILDLDFQFKVRQRREFFNALITEVGFPAADAASRDPATMTVRFAPEYTRYTKPSGSGKPPVGKVQKKWLPSNFKLTIDGLDTKKVNKVDAIVFKQNVSDAQIGEGRDYEKLPGPPEVSNLGVTLAEAGAQTFQDWFDDFVIKGNAGSEQEKTGSLEFLAPDLKTSLFRLDFTGIGIVSLKSVESTTADRIRRVKAEMYVETIAFAYNGAVVG
jgi:hypothetical protein